MDYSLHGISIKHGFYEDNKMEKDKISASVKYLVFIFWTAGYMFCLGFIGMGSSFETYTFFEKTITVILSYLFWPILLGMQLKQ